MATDFTQDTLLHFLQSHGGQVKNSDLLLHFRNFIRDHADRNRNRELFKKFVNSVATVKQIDGVSYVVVRKKFRGHVPGGGEGGSSESPRLPAGKNTEPSPENSKLNPAWSSEKPRQKPQQREVTAPAPAGVTAKETILPAAGILLLNNNNNNVETNLNLKRKPVTSTPELVGRPEAAQVVSQTPSLAQPPTPHQSTKVGQHRGGSGLPPGTTPAVRPHGEPNQQQVPVPEPLRGREARLQPEVGLHQEPPLHHASPQGRSAPRHQEPPLHHASPQGQSAPRHQEPPLHHASLQGQSAPRHQEPPLHHASPQGQSAPRHQDPPLHHASLQGQSAPRHQEPPLHHASPQGQSAPRHQEPPLHHASLQGQSAPRHQEPPLHHASLQGQSAPRHQEPPLHHASLQGQSATRHQESPLHHASPQGQSAPRHQEPPLHHASPQGQSAPRHQEPPLHHASQIAPRRIRHRKSYKSAVSYDEDEDGEEEVEAQMRRGSEGGAWPLSIPLKDTGRAISASSPCIIEQPVVSSPSLSSTSSERKLPQIYVQDVEGKTLPPGGLGWSLGSGVGHRGQWKPGTVPGEPSSTRRSLPLEAERYVPSPDRATVVASHRNVHADRRYSQPAGVQLDHKQEASLSQGAWSSSHSGSFSPSSDAGFSSSDWPPSGSPKGSGWNSRSEDPQPRAGQLQRAQGTTLESVTHHANNKTTAPWHHSTGNLHDDQEPVARLSPLHRSSDHLHIDQSSTARVMPWHLSTGDLYDREEAESSDGSTSSPPLRLRPPVARRISSQLRSRMCRSLGADLDQLIQEEEKVGGGSEAARLNRLHMISSSLSLRYNLSSSSLSSCSTPPRCHSFTDLNEGVEGRGGRSSPAAASSPAHHEGSSRQSLIPLEPREHAWLVKGAAGAWPDIYTLFREDSSLLNRQDFISGFTVLHWIAKHGDHRVLNTLWYGVQKAGLTFDINAKSTCGHTPLHIAAMHGNKNIMRLLVNKFHADVKLRDTAGKKPWQYLSRAALPDVFQLLGAPSRLTGKGEGGVGGEDPSLEHGQQQRRRRRHHLSFASLGDRPLTMTGTTRVKRSSSIAAFLKHKSMLRFHGHQSDSSV